MTTQKMLANLGAFIVAGLHDLPPQRVEPYKPKPKPPPSTTKRAKVKAARKQKGRKP